MTGTSLYGEASFALKLIIVHYHFRPGGIRRVIELATPWLVRQFNPVESVVLACGQADDAQWNDDFAGRLRPVPVEFFVNRAFRYLSEQHSPSGRIKKRVAAGLTELLDGLSREDCLVWAHNLGVGRNLILTRELTRACEKRDIPLVAHHHDWWFDNRWLRWPEMRRFGFRSLAASAGTIFPPSQNVRHVAINRTDAAVLQHHFPGRAGWLPNLAEYGRPPAQARVHAARVWLQRKIGDNDGPVWILPCRLLRRKNIAEALLLKNWLRPEAWLATTGGVSSADEIPYYAKLNLAAQQNRWPLRLGILDGDERRRPGVAELVAASEAVMLTSIQEGFGLPYLEAAAAGRPLIARAIPSVFPDLKQLGFCFPQSYNELLVHPGLFDWDAEHNRQTKLFRHWKAQLPDECRRWADRPAVLAGSRPRPVPFSRLTLTAQLEVLARPICESWGLCAPLNSFLQAWRIRATSGRLEATPWPHQAADRLSGPAYARGFHKILRATVRKKAGRIAAVSAQEEFIRQRLRAAHLFPLLWSRDS